MQKKKIEAKGHKLHKTARTMQCFKNNSTLSWIKLDVVGEGGREGERI
jgi:hypothetical protein